MDILSAVLMIFFGYLLGSVPTGFLLASLSGVDVRRAGSGNVGATNVARVVGKVHGILTLIGDAAKGFIPAFFSYQMEFGAAVTGLAALAAFLGHLYPVFLRFQGGKGVATALGIFLALAPAMTAVLMSVFLLVVAVSRTVSLGSLVTAAVAPIVFWFSPGSLPLVGLSVLISLFIFIRHRENIRRLVSGAEPKFRF